MTLLKNWFRLKPKTGGHLHILEPVAYREAIKTPGVQLLDVRTAGEFRQGHIRGAINLDYYQSEAFTSGAEAMNKTQPVYLYCRSGNRSRHAANRLIKQGFTEIYDLKGGFLNWKE